MKKHYGWLLLFCIGAIGNAWAQPGIPDASFAAKGFKEVSFKKNLSGEYVGASVQDAAGNVYIAGNESAPNTHGYVMKMLPNGKLDETFGKNGKAVVFIDGGEGYIIDYYPLAITLLPSGSIILAGYSTPDGAKGCFMKLNSDGSLDTNFGYNGYYDNYNYESFFSTVTITADNKIVAGGGSYAKDDYYGYADFMITVLDTTGAPISIKGNENGEMDIDFFTKNDYITGSVVKDDIIYFAGTANNQNGYTRVAYTAFNLSKLDTLAGQGKVMLEIDASTDQNNYTCTAVQPTPDGGLLFGGYVDYSVSGNRDFLLAKTKSDGSRDITSFTSTGFQFYQIGTNSSSTASSAMYLDNSGNILLGGYTTLPSDAEVWAVIRVNLSGATLDGTYAASTAVQSLNSSQSGLTNIIKAKDGNYLFIGDANLTNLDVIVKKVSTTGADVSTFGKSSIANFWVEDYISTAYDMVQTSNGQFWVCGHYLDVNTIAHPCVALLNSDGSLDTISVKGNDDPGIVNLATLISGISIQFATTLTLQNDGTLLVAGTFFNVAAGGNGIDAFVTNLKKDGTLNTSFGSPNGYTNWVKGDSYPHDIIAQPNDSKILVYGYANNSLTVGRFNPDGSMDGVFKDPINGTSGYFQYVDVSQFSSIDLNTVQMKLQTDGKIVCAGTTFINDSNGDFLVFRLTKDGALDTSFASGKNGLFTSTMKNSYDYADYASSVELKPDGTILVGGYSAYSDDNSSTKYALMQLTPAGIIDSVNFATKGIYQLDENYQQQGVRDIKYESANAITVVGLAGAAKDNSGITAFRLTAAGKLDNTFNGQGHYMVKYPGYPRTTQLYNGKLYIIGADNRPDQPTMNGLLARLVLGTGPVIKTTTLKMQDVNKTFGDAPFLANAISNSPAPITYTITQGNACATVDAKTGLITVTCVITDPPIGVTATQPAISGYTAASAFMNVNVNQAIPTIVFSDLGGVIGDTIPLTFQSNSTGPHYFSFSSPNFTPWGADSVIIVGEGSTQVSLTQYSTQNYTYGYAYANLFGYITPVPPVAADDQQDVIQGIDKSVDIAVLANDKGNTGHLVPALIDLDPSTAEIDKQYYSPALGAFTHDDTSGLVHFIPFQGLVGYGEIHYTVTDSRGDVSNVATIKITAKVLGSLPALKATELVTPNNDGLNDAFVIGFVDLTKDNVLKLYDRNGEELITITDYKNDWDGDLPNGKIAENGIYYYLYTEGTTGTDQRQVKGVVELKR